MLLIPQRESLVRSKLGCREFSEPGHESAEGGAGDDEGRHGQNHAGEDS